MKNFFTSHDENWHCCRRAQKFSENYVNVFLNLGKFAVVGISIQSMPCWEQERLKIYSALFPRHIQWSEIFYEKVAWEPTKQRACVMDFERVCSPLDNDDFELVSEYIHQNFFRIQIFTDCFVLMAFEMNVFFFTFEASFNAMGSWRLISAATRSSLAFMWIHHIIYLD